MRYCLTTDVLDGIYKKRFPDLFYIRHLIRRLQGRKRLAVAKSRQIMGTWTVCSYLLWVALFHSATLCGIQAQEHDKGDDHLENKIKVMYEGLPKWLKNQKPAKSILHEFTIYHDQLNSGSNSRIISVPKGDAAARQYTFTVYFIDEAAHQPLVGRAFIAAIPTTQGRGEKEGQIVMLTTANGKEFFWSMWDNGNKTWTEITKGLKEKENKNGFTALRIHYSADPLKDEKWVNKMRSSYPGGLSGWEMEQEINFDAGSGNAYFPEYIPERHQLNDPLQYRDLVLPDVPLLRGMDYGYQNPACMISQLRPNGQWVFIKEYTAERKSLPKFMDEITDDCEIEFPDHHQSENPDDMSDYEEYGDVAGNQTNDQTTLTNIQLLGETYNIFQISSKQPKVLGYQIFRHWLQMTIEGEGLLSYEEDGVKKCPAVVVFEPGCPVFAEGLRGGFTFKTNKVGQAFDESYDNKNIYVHLMDAMKYTAHNKYEIFFPFSDKTETIKEKRQRTLDEIASDHWLAMIGENSREKEQHLYRVDR